MTTARQPEPNVEVFELGHYESLHLTLALKQIISEDEAEYDQLLDDTDTDVIASLLHIFASGNVTIIRKAY